MAFVWSSINVGDIITYSPNIQIDELRDNADWLDDNAADKIYHGTVQTNYNLGVDASQNTVYDSSVYVGHFGSVNYSDCPSDNAQCVKS